MKLCGILNVCCRPRGPFTLTCTSFSSFVFLSKSSLGCGFGGAGLLVRVNQYPRWSWLFPHWAQESISHRLHAHKPSGLVLGRAAVRSLFKIQVPTTVWTHVYEVTGCVTIMSYSTTASGCGSYCVPIIVDVVCSHVLSVYW